MPISEKLALEIYTIELFHIAAMLITFGFTFYLLLKAKKTPLFYSFLAVVGMLSLWMISKILKSVSPNESIRWFFIVTQYFGIQFLGLAVILFALLLSRNYLPSIKVLIILALLPLAGFIIVATNPWHHLFYSYYDFYKDSFGPLFYPIAMTQYLYLFTGIFMLSKGFTLQPQFKNRKKLARIFALIILIPISGNIYYLLVKLTDVPFVFNFPFFDFTPITSAIALMLFILPAFKYRFLDISPIAYRHIFENIPEGLVFIKNKTHLYSCNKAFRLMFPNVVVSSDIYLFANSLPFADVNDRNKFIEFINSNIINDYFQLSLSGDHYYKVFIGLTKKKQTIIRFTDLSAQYTLTNQLNAYQLNLANKNTKLEQLAVTSRELARTRAHTKVAQDVHDILGHSMTVVIGICDLACMDTTLETSYQRISQVKELLLSGVSDLRNSLNGKSIEISSTTLVKSIKALNNSNIELDFTVQGKPYELSTMSTEAIFRTCQEAMTNSIKHGKASTIHITLRFKHREIELYIIDDGVGCKVVTKSLGLIGIESRINQLNGNISFGSDGEKGFNIHLTIPAK